MSALLDTLLPPERAQPAPADIYEPHCVMQWREQMAAMDETGGIAMTKPTTEYSKNYSGTHDKPPTEAACTS